MVRTIFSDWTSDLWTLQMNIQNILTQTFLNITNQPSHPGWWLLKHLLSTSQQAKSRSCDASMWCEFLGGAVTLCAVNRRPKQGELSFQCKRFNLFFFFWEMGTIYSSQKQKTSVWTSAIHSFLSADGCSFIHKCLLPDWNWSLKGCICFLL